MNNKTLRAKALSLLQPWPSVAEKYWWDDPARPDLGCFGTGYNSWGVQTNQKYLGALAVLATASDLNERAVGAPRERLLDRALRALRYSLASHVSGDHHCSDGTQWGHTWISGLGIERMMHGVQALDKHLTDEDREAVRRLLCSEADALLELPVQGTLWAEQGGNKPESNIWNGAICCRAALNYPDHPHAADWTEQAHILFVNGISIPADADDDTLQGGKPIRERHIGPNFFPHYALDHHGYLNVGYMVICLSNIAMLHYGLTLQGLTPPETLYHHAQDLWQLVRQFIFEDGRLLRIGGDSRQRYCYCQDYLLPTLCFCHEYWGDERAGQLAAGCLDLIHQERDFNADGSFLSQRLETIRQVNPYYYTRLESDKAVVLSMCAYWATKTPAAAPVAELEPAQWEEPEHGAVFHRSPRRVASWSWRAREAPQGLCLPPQSGHLAEWCESMGGRVRIAGEQGMRKVQWHKQWSFDGGFVTIGEMADSTKAYFGEGWTSPERAPHQLAVAALPDDRTMIVLEYATVGIRTYLTEVKGLKLNVPNDLFNGFKRNYYSESGHTRLEGKAEGVTALESRYVNIEDTIGVISVYGGDTISVCQAGKRRASGYEDSLYYDEVCSPCEVGLWDVPPGTVVLDCANVVLSGTDSQETCAAADGVKRLETAGLLRAVQVPGADGAEYVLVANFGEEPVECPAEGAIIAGESAGSLVGAHEARLLCLRPLPHLPLD
ncbi:MAG: hypothetical protein ABFD96_03610 [Armatimonadia bacterium]